jgi:diaminohydroxyphosphoribosylaminopyrimidine deaminase / 5-amino-6-(5-phosphoribosylamino)uracil reductase
MSKYRHESFMQRCLELASLGLGRVQPNPMVGAVIVANGIIIGEGWHRQYGDKHAEINAINSVENPVLLKNSTLYVNLEPCSHYGKTPPCADAIIRAGIPEVVIGNIDPNAKVNGEGINKLKTAGVKVIVNVLEEQCRDLNCRFFTFHKLQRPYIILKWAQTSDGFMDVERRNDGDIESYWITNAELRVIVHKWRSEEDAILVGYNTMIHDKPQLTNRLYSGKNPARFVMQKSVAPSFFDEYYSVLPENLVEAMHSLHHQNIQSLIVEGGRKTLDRFLNAGLWDEARILIGSQQWGKGLKAPQINQIPDNEIVINDNIIRYVHRHV